jgi:hypothetical protein
MNKLRKEIIKMGTSCKVKKSQKFKLKIKKAI